MQGRRVALTGATGQLGRAIQDQAGADWEIHPLHRAEIDITNWDATQARIHHIEPDLVIHAAAATDVDGCEREPEQAYLVNALATRYLAQAAAQVGAEFVYVSTNFVFDGEMSRPYHEFDTPNPINVYGASKLAGEVETREALERAYIVRTAMVFDEVGRNFVNTMRRLMAERPRLTVVADQVGNPTYASDLAAGIIRLVGRAPYGTYHLTNGGVASWFEWAQTVAELTGSTTEIVPIPASEYQRAARPPANGSMISLALPSLGVCLPDWRDALSRCLGR